MTYLKPLRPPTPLLGNGWSGLYSEYRGVFPDNELPSHYLVLCLYKDGVGISFTLVTSVQEFEVHEAFYRWLLEKHLTLVTVVHLPGSAAPVPEKPAVAARAPARKASLLYWIVGGFFAIGVVGKLLQPSQVPDASAPKALEAVAPKATEKSQALAPKPATVLGQSTLKNPCNIVGVWEVTFGDRLLAITSLNPDGTFHGELKYDSPSGPYFSGSWSVGKHVNAQAIYWKNDPPAKLSEEINDLRGPENGVFYLKERDNNYTKWRYIRAIPTTACEEEAERKLQEEGLQ